MKKVSFCIYLLAFIILSSIASANDFLINPSTINTYGLPIHLFEIFLALFICFMSLKFFRITRPLNIFLYIYLALGFLIISSLLYIVYYFRGVLSLELDFANVYLASRLSLIAMLAVFVAVFYNANRLMKEPIKTESEPTIIGGLKKAKSK